MPEHFPGQVVVASRLALGQFETFSGLGLLTSSKGFLFLLLLLHLTFFGLQPFLSHPAQTLQQWHVVFQTSQGRRQVGLIT